MAASATINSTTYTTNSTTLVLSLPSIDASGNAIASTYDTVVFYTSGGTAYAIVSADASSDRDSRTKQLATGVTALTFTYDNPTPSSARNVTVDATVNTSYAGTTMSYHMNQRAYLRN